MIAITPLVSVVTVTYNAANCIERCIASVNDQSYANIEHVFIDGSSTDSTIEIIKKASSRIYFLVSEPDNGIYDAMNKALRFCKGEIICFLNSDDQYFSSESMREVVDSMIKYKAGFAFGEAIYSTSLGIIKRRTESSFIDYFKLPVSQIAHPCLFVTKDIIQKYSLHYPRQYTIAADLYYQSLLFRNRVPFVYISKTLVNIQLGGVSTVSMESYLRGWKQALSIYLRVYNFKGVFFFLGKLLFKIPFLGPFPSVQKK